MAVLAFREILPRTFSHKFGESPTAEVRYALTLDGPTSHQAMITAVGIVHGTPHPEYSYLLCLEGSVNETGVYNAEITYRYGTPEVGTAQYQASPLARADVWSFSTSGVAVPTFRYYNGNGNGDIKPLVNSAGDIIEGAQAIEGELRVTIAGNRAVFPAADAIAVTGALNSDSYLGASPYQWQCLGIGGQQATEVVNGAQVTYWQVTVELSYKQSGYQLYLPNAGLNFLEGGVLTRAYVIHPDTKEQIPSASPVKLTAAGAIQFVGDPIILTRRVNPAANFASYFGAPPF